MMLGEKNYLLDLSSATGEGINELCVGGRLSGRIYVHLGYFRIIDAPEEAVSYSIILEKLYKSSKETELFTIELTDYMPKGLTYKDFKENRNHFIINVAKDLGLGIITNDNTLISMAQSLGIDIIKIPYRSVFPSFTKFFEGDVMSVHLKEGVPPMIKRGKPGEWKLEYIGTEPTSRSELEALLREVHEYSVSASESVKEIIRPGSLIAQVGHYRIVATKPPLSDGMEITIVKPLRKLRLSDYRISRKLLERFEKRAEGILIAGAPGMGKTTFAQALAEFYYEKGKIVKTVESPRDMQLPPEITQLSKTYATSEELHDVLLLSRPDYTIYDEMRDTNDFELFTDLRLAGVGMVGVVHATSPIDAVQRFISRVDLGMIPSIIDTVVFIKNGDVEKVYTLETTVKVPHGLTESDLARPVVIVRNAETDEPEYEIYVFGERTFVVPIKKTMTRQYHIAEKQVRRVLSHYVPDDEITLESNSENKMLIKVPPEYMPMIMGKTRKKLDKISRQTGIQIEITPTS